MKLKEYVPVLVIAVLISGCSIVGYLIMQSGRGAGDPKQSAMLIDVGPVVSEAESVKSAVQMLVRSGSSPENITFTGAHSPDDVFGSGTMDANDLSLPPATVCASCSGWKFLPAAKKDYGWYVYSVGTPAADIIAFYPGITEAACNVIQRGLGYISHTLPKQAGSPFDPAKPGSYSDKGSSAIIKSQDSTLDGQSQACFDNHVSAADASNFSFYYVMLAQ